MSFFIATKTSLFHQHYNYYLLFTQQCGAWQAVGQGHTARTERPEACHLTRQLHQWSDQFHKSTQELISCQTG